MNATNFRRQKANEWFKKGDSDLRTAEILVKEEHPPTDTACFHCQQAVEKYLKGYLTLKGIDFLKSHDLDYLLKLCVDLDKNFADHEETVLTLNKYGIEPRYPADIPVYYSVEETKRAVELAKEMMNFIKGVL
ncbi:MAG: HEPN domain-containing protein [Candidatus Omnitrophica bacterium]|nr:HEPN domain-containing protein [Candidatus Omnitrophota bacterium]